MTLTRWDPHLLIPQVVQNSLWISVVQRVCVCVWCMLLGMEPKVPMVDKHSNARLQPWLLVVHFKVSLCIINFISRRFNFTSMRLCNSNFSRSVIKNTQLGRVFTHTFKCLQNEMFLPLDCLLIL